MRFILCFQDAVTLLGASECLKVHQKSDNLIFRFTVKVSYEVRCYATMGNIFSSFPNVITSREDLNGLYLVDYIMKGRQIIIFEILVFLLSGVVRNGLFITSYTWIII